MTVGVPCDNSTVEPTKKAKTMLHCVSTSRPSSCRRAANSVFPVLSGFEKKWDTVFSSPAAKNCHITSQTMQHCRALCQ